MEPHIYGVTEVNQLVKGLLDSAPALQGVADRGELSNYKIYPSGHHYFTLKDQEGPSGASCSGDRPPASGSGRRTA